MLLSKMFLPTRRDAPADAEVASHSLLVRAGFIRMLARGIYTLLPLGWRTVRKIEDIVREEMDRAGALELLMPGVQPAELWQESGRWNAYGAELLRMTDRKGSEFCLGPTHEEVITWVARNDLSSYRQLPMNLYQIQTKFRDEPRPRFGLMRGREFIMKDAYSFDIDREGAEASYGRMADAYDAIFGRIFGEAHFAKVDADSGNIGGSLSQEFQVLATTGEDRLVRCGHCGYAANVEKAKALFEDSARADDAAMDEVAEVATPGQRSIEEVSAFLGCETSALLKTLIYVIDGVPVAVLARGDHEINPLKLRAVAADAGIGEGGEAELASDELVGKVTRAPVGFAGPVGLEGVAILADEAVRGVVNAVVGANKKDAHLRGVNWGRDYEVTRFADLRAAGAGDTCGHCGVGTFEALRGIEVGHIFYLGTKYSDAMGLKLQDDTGQQVPLEMGCYGIGITRIMAAAVEQNHDDNGIIWPQAIAPYQVVILPLQMKDEAVLACAHEIYASLQEAGVEVVLDDRDTRAGAKFKDADLVGYPLQVAIGSRSLAEGNVEVKVRGEADKSLVARAGVVAHLRGLMS